MGEKRKRRAQEAYLDSPTAKKQQKEDIKPSNTNITPSKAVTTLFIQYPKGEELKREVLLYENLSARDEVQRLEAADTVVSALLSGEGVSEAILQRHLERRLFRGLASGRKAARLGFSIALTEVLAQLLGDKKIWRERYPGLTFDNVLDILRAKTKPKGDLSGQEERDHAFGLLFGLQCFVRAKILFDNMEGRWEKVFESLIQLAKKKTWTREECGWVIVEALEQMSQLEAEFTLEKLQEIGLASSPEGVGVWLTARRRFPTMKFPIKPWGRNGNPLEHLSALAKVLKESSGTVSEDNAEMTQQTGNWRPQLHFVWDIVLNECIKTLTAELHHPSSAHFIDFWKVAVDESLFSSSASTERKFWGFLLFQKAFKGVANYPWLLEKLFSQNFMRCLINHISQEDRFLHRAADKCIKSILQEAESNKSIIEMVIPGLISNFGVYNFDQVTKTKTVDKILSQLGGEQIGRVIDKLFSPIKEVKTVDSSKDAELRRQIFGDYIVSMIRRNANKQEDNTWIRTHALPQVTSLAYSVVDDFTPPISEKTRTIFRNRLNSSFSHLISDSNSFSYPCELLLTLKPNAVDMDDKISAIKDKALRVMEKLMKKAQKSDQHEKKPLQALSLLYALAIFQLYNGEPDAVALLGELKLCYDTLIRGKDTKEFRSDASAVLVEILLSLITRQSVLFRKIAQQVFSAFSAEITQGSLQVLVDVLGSSESIKGQHELFDEELELGDEDDELDSDVEVIDTNGLHDDSKSKGVEDEDEGDDDSEADEEEDDDEARRLDDALAKALGTHRADQGGEDESLDGDSDMSDSEMLALDAKLVEIFSQRKQQQNKKQEKKGARETIVNFKSRVLDLLEIFAKEQTASPLAFDLLLPMLKLMRNTTAKQLSEKAFKVITAFAKAWKGLKIGDHQMGLQASQRLQILKDIHEEAPKDPSHAFAKATSTASLLVAASLYRAEKHNIKKIATVYRDSQVAWLERGTRMQASFFHDWVNWCQSLAS